MSVIINTNSRSRFTNRNNNSLNINENSRTINNSASLNINSNPLILNSNTRELQANSNSNELIDNTASFVVNTNNVDKELRYVDLVINDFVLLSEKTRFNLPENIVSYKDINTPKNIKDFYNNENFKINENVCLLHGVKSAYDNIISNEITEFSNIKIEIIKSLESKLKSQIIKFSKKNKFLIFLDNNIKENQIFFQDTKSYLENSLDKINQLVNNDNYVHVVQNSLGADNLESNYFGKLFNIATLEKENIVLLSKSSINSNQIDSEIVSDISSDFVNKKIGIDFKKSDSPFMSLKHNYNNNSFISQLLANASFSFYGMYPTVLLDEVLYLQNLKDKYPSVIINYFNENANPFLDINTISKSFNNLKYYENDFNYFSDYKGINLNDIVYENNEDITSDLGENQATNFQKFTSIFYANNLNPQQPLPLLLGNIQSENVEEIESLNNNTSYISRLSTLTPFNNTLADISEPEYYSLDKIKYNSAKCDLFYNSLNNDIGRRIYRYIIDTEGDQNNILKRIIEDINDNKISDISKFINYLSPEAYEFLLNSMFYGSNDNIYFNKITNIDSLNQNNNPLTRIDDFVNSNFTFRVKRHVSGMDYVNNFRLQELSCNVRNLKKLKQFLDFYNSISDRDKINYLHRNISKIDIELDNGEVNSIEDLDRILYFLNRPESFINEARFQEENSSGEVLGYFDNNKKVELLDKFVFEYLNSYYYSLFYLSFNFNNLRTNVFYVILQTIVRFYNNVSDIEQIFERINVNPNFTLTQFFEIIEYFSTDEAEIVDQSEFIFKSDLINADSNLNNQEFISNARLDNFIENIENTKNTNRDTGYLYYTTNFNDQFENRNLTNKQYIQLSENVDLYKNSNYSSYKISFYVDELVKKIKLYSLEKNSVNYSVFKNIAKKLSNFGEEVFEIPVFCSNEDKKLGFLDESQNAFNYLLSKSGEFYYSNLDFTNNISLKDLKIKNTLHAISEGVGPLLDFNNELKNMLEMFSNYYYDNSINMSNHLIKKIVKEVKEPTIETSINDDALTFLYFTNFETNETNTNFNAKDSIIKRFIKKAVSFRNNANSNLKNSNLGYEFTTSTADFDALGSFSKEILEENSDVLFHDYSTEIVEYFTSLFSTNEDYNIIRNAIFNNNENIDLQYDFYYIPIESINTKTKKFNFHICFNKFRDSHQDFTANMSPIDANGGSVDFDINTDPESFGFLFDTYTYCFPNTILKKKNIPYKIPEKFINREEIKNKSFNNKTIVKNYVRFDSNINDKKASAFITYNIKNEKNEFATVARKKITDEFDKLCKKENTVFNNIVKKINIILEASTNIKDLSFEDISDIDDFIDNNKFILGLISSLVTIYSEIYNKNYRENQTKNFIKNINELQFNNVIEDYNFNNVDVSEVKSISAEFVDLTKNNDQNILDFNDISTHLTSYNEILRRNFIKLKDSDYLQAITLDMISGYFRKVIEFNNNKEENIDIVVNNSVSNLTNALKITNQQFLNKINLFDLNSISKETSEAFYKVKNNYKNLIKDQQNNENIKDFYSNRIDKLYSNYLNTNVENLESNNFSILKDKSLNKVKILTFGLKKSILKNINFDQMIKISVSVRNLASDQNIIRTKEFLFSPILTGFNCFYNDNVNLDRNIGLYDIFKEDINERFVIVNRETAKSYLKKITNLNNNNDSHIDKAISDHIESNILDKILNLFYDFKMDINDYLENSNTRYSEIDLLDQINKLSSFDFTNIFKYDKTKFDNTITTSEDIVVLPDFIESLESKSLVYEFMYETSKIYSNVELQNVFKNKEFYDFYNISIPISNNLETIEIEYSIENIS